MKLTKLSNRFLKHMVSSYHKDSSISFKFDDFKVLCNNYHDNTITDSIINDALYLLQKDGLVRISPYNDIAFFVYLETEAIRLVEENTFLKKIYSVFKEIKSLI